MSLIILDTSADEGGVYGIQVTFTNAAGTAATPKTLTWTLVDRAGAVINGRQDVAVSSLASTVVIVLSGDDLAISDSTKNREQRELQISGTYDDAVLGNDVPIKAQVRFPVSNRLDVST